jgi:N utilization substance protein A
MNGQELVRIVDAMHREKNIPKDIIFEGIEAAILLAARKHYDDELMEMDISIDRDTGELHARKGEEEIDPAILGRIAAQSAKQVMIQKIREAECSSVYDDYVTRKGDMIVGTVNRIENGAALVSVGKSEALLPRSEQIPGESFHVGQRVKAVILDVRKVGTRVRIVLSRTHPEFVRRLFEQEIPEVQDRTIEIRAVAREAGYRTKIAVSSIDTKVDAVGACVGVRGSRIKNIVDELNGERIDIVRWNESLQVMIPNALQPAQIEEVFLYQRLGRAIVLVKEDQLSLAIGRRGQNVRLASKLVGWDIEIMTQEEYDESLVRAETWFSGIPGVTPESVETFVVEGFLSYDDLTFLEVEEMAELAGVSEEDAMVIIEYAEQAAANVEKEEARMKAEQAELAAAQAEAQAADGVPQEAGAAPAPLRSGTGPRPHDIFPVEPAAEVAETKHTVESIFGPDTDEKPAEQKLSAAQVFGNAAPPAPPPQRKDDDE